MLFNSLPFVAFLGVVCSLFYLLPTHFRLGWLLLASYFFYSWWNPVYVPLLVGYTLINYVWGQQLGRANSYRTMLVISGVVMNLLPLLYYKYWPFSPSVGSGEPTSARLIPLGISFITLQAIAYLVDIYRHKIEPVGLLRFALYKAFFPQLLAGPIERAGNLIPQFSFSNAYSPTLFLSGGKLILWGYFKKVLIADKIGLLVDPVFDHPQAYPALGLLIVPFLFSLQIYCDFSGYTDIARGIAMLFGIQLSINFCRPYLSANLRLFWQRWHITLHDWFKDYVYKPLLGQRPTWVTRITSILVVFVVSGLWHGANLTFLVWGFYHACLYMLTYFSQKLPVIWPEFVCIFLTFAAVSFGWIFFRAPSLQEASYMFEQLGHLPELSLPTQLSQCLSAITQHTALSSRSLEIIFSLLLVFILVEGTGLLDAFLQTESARVIPVYRLLLLDLFILLLVLFGDWAGTTFIYYQF